MPFLENSYCGIVTLHPVNNYKNAVTNKMFEYMAAGLAQITSDFPMWRKIIDENKCGICINPKDSDKIAEAIESLYDNEKLVLKMSENAKSAVTKKFSWDIESKKLLLAYEKLFEHIL